MIAILFAYLFLIAILNYMGYISYVPLAIPIFIAIVVWMNDAKEIDNKPVAFILGIAVAGLYYYGYEFLFASKSTGVFTYIFIAFVAFLLAIYVMGIKKFSTDAIEMGVVFLIFVALLAFLSPVFLGINRWATQDTKMSMLASMKEAFDQVYYTKADSFSGYIKNFMNALNPNTYIVTPSTQNGEENDGVVYNPEEDIKKDKDESFIAHLSTAKGKAVFLPYFSPGVGKEGLKDIRFIVKNEKYNIGVFKYRVGYLLGTDLFSSGLACKDNKPYCLTGEGDVLMGGESKEERITLKIPKCNAGGNIYFYKKYISITQSRKKIDLERRAEREKTLVSNDPVNLIINDIITEEEGRKEIIISITPFVDKKDIWKRKGYVPYIMIAIPSWLEPTEECEWKKKMDKKDGDVIYSVDLTKSMLCLEEGKIGNTYSCKFKMKKDLRVDYFDVYAVAPYLIKEYIGPQKTGVRLSQYSSCSAKDSESVKDAIKKVKEYFDFDDDNIDSGDYLLYIRGAKLKSNLDNAITALARYCAELNEYNPTSMNCFSIEFQLTKQSKGGASVNKNKEDVILHSSDIEKEKIDIFGGDVERNALVSIANGVFKNKVAIKFTPDSKTRLGVGSSYILDISFKSGCNEGTVWVNIYD